MKMKKAVETAFTIIAVAVILLVVFLLARGKDAYHEDNTGTIARVTHGQLYVRENPNGEVIATISYGEKLTLTGYEHIFWLMEPVELSHWTEIQWEDQTAWVSTVGIEVVE